jgi:hypothetical protein
MIQIDDVPRDYFSHLELDKFLCKIAIGEIALPLVRMEKSQKSAKGVYVQDLADYTLTHNERKSRRNAINFAAKLLASVEA